MQSPVLIPSISGIRIVRQLGRGGMGAVFLASDERVHRTVALKVISSNGVVDPAAHARFDREIEAVSSIHHANVVRLVRSGVVGDVPFAEFERIHGRSLAKIGRLPWQVVVDLGRQLASAVAAVHAVGWVHRDLKPSNVMVCDHGLVTLIDFGVAKRVGAPSLARGSESGGSPALTLRGKLVGTRRYLAPETLQGRPATPATDVYSLGLILRDLLDHSMPPPAALVDLLIHALATDPRHRPEAADVAACLAELPGRAGVFSNHASSEVPTWPIDADQRATGGDPDDEDWNAHLLR